jgi:hypothetical protein
LFPVKLLTGPNVERRDSIKEQKGQTYQVIGNDSVLPEISVIT